MKEGIRCKIFKITKTQITCIYKHEHQKIEFTNVRI